MYKVEEEEIEKRLSKIRKSSGFDIFMIVLGLVLVFGGVYEEDLFPTAFGILIFVFSFVNYYYITPLLGKVQMLESEVKRLKEKVGLEDEKRY